LDKNLSDSVARGDVAATENLLSKGADFNVLQYSKKDALETSIALGNIKLFKLLYRHGTFLKKTLTYMANPLSFLKIMLHGNSTSNWNMLMLSALNGREKIVDFLLREGFDPSIEYIGQSGGMHSNFPRDKGIALELAVQSGDINTIKLLLKKTPKKTLLGRHRYGETYLAGYIRDVIEYPKAKYTIYDRLIVKQNYIKKEINQNKGEIISMLFETMKKVHGLEKAKSAIRKNNLNVLISGEKDLTIFWLTTYPWILDELDKKKVVNDVVEKISHYRNNNISYRYRKVPTILNYLSKFDFDPNLITPGNKILILSEITEEHLSLASSFLKRGLNINQLKPSIHRVSYNALQLAVRSGYIESVKILLDLGADISIKGISFSESLLNMTYHLHSNKSQQTLIAKLLIERGLDINSTDNRGRTALFDLAKLFRPIEDLKLLLDSGAEVNTRDIDGKTPLMYAAYKNNVEAIKFLLDKGADPNLKDKSGNSAYDISVGSPGWNNVKSNNKQKITDLLRPKK